jgi:mRNA-degrading endonuclease RelE of RelBE toxin-antitoxin system
MERQIILKARFTCFYINFALNCFVTQSKKDVIGPCEMERAFCVNCNSIFRRISPSIEDILVTKRFTKDVKDGRNLRSIISDIVDCSSLDFDELHKFEKSINGYLIFRAKRAKMHIVYGIDEKKQLIFVRAIRISPNIKNS